MATSTRGAGSALPPWLDEELIAASPTRLAQLEVIVAGVGRSPWLWGHTVSFHRDRRSHRVLYKTDALEIGLFGWVAGQDTVFHDHGGASGAVFVCSGSLIEDVVEAVDGLVVRRESHVRGAESVFSFGPDYIHRVQHDPDHGVALSLHAYTPATAASRDYALRPDGAIRSLRSPEPDTVGVR